MSGHEYVNAYDVRVALQITNEEYQELVKDIPREKRTGRPLRSKILEIMTQRGIPHHLLEETYE